MVVCYIHRQGGLEIPQTHVRGSHMAGLEVVEMLLTRWPTFPGNSNAAKSLHRLD